MTNIITNLEKKESIDPTDTNCRFTVYCHINKINQKKYIGITGRIPEHRWGKNGNGYKNQMFGQAIQKYGWDNFEHKIIATHLTKKEAEQMEIDLISKMQTRNPKYGYNIAVGGGEITEKQVKHLYQYDSNGTLIKYWEDYHDAAIALNVDLRTIRTSIEKDYRLHGYIFRWDLDQNIAPRKDVISRTKPISQYDLYGNWIANFDCIHDAEKLYKMQAGRIYTCCIGSINTCGGYYWFFQDDPMLEDKLHKKCIAYKDSYECQLKTYNIQQYDKNNVFLKEYRDMLQAAEENNIPYKHILTCYDCARGKYNTGRGFIWKITDKKRGVDMSPVLYMQHDKRWAEHDYSAKGEKTTIKAEGCGTTCAAMVIATLADKSVTPITTSDWSKSHGYKAPHQGTYYSYFKPQFEKYGLKCRMVNSQNCYHDPKAKCHKEALNAIDNGDFVIACMGKGNWTTSGHYVLWHGMEGNNVLINDPWSVKKQQTNASYDLFRNEVKYYWIISVTEKYKEDDIMVVEDIIMVDGKEHKVQMVRKDGYTYLNTRQLCEILNFEVDSEGRIPILTKKK